MLYMIIFIDFCLIIGINFAIEAKPLELYVPEEQGGIRYHIWRLVTSAPFENFIMLLIVCNTILLMLKVSIFSSFFWNNLIFYDSRFLIIFSNFFPLVQWCPMVFHRDSQLFQLGLYTAFHSGVCI